MVDGLGQGPRGSTLGTSLWRRVHFHLHRNRVTSLLTKLVVTVVGLLVLAAGVVMMVTPGPGLLAIAGGLAILATEWDWADRWLAAARYRLERARSAAFGAHPRTKARRRKVAGAAGASAVLVGLAALLLAPDLIGG